MPEGGPPSFITGLFLRVEILADFTHDAQDLALPRFEQRAFFSIKYSRFSCGSEG